LNYIVCKERRKRYSFHDWGGQRNVTFLNRKIWFFFLHGHYKRDNFFNNIVRFMIKVQFTIQQWLQFVPWSSTMLWEARCHLEYYNCWWFFSIAMYKHYLGFLYKTDLNQECISFWRTTVCSWGLYALLVCSFDISHWLTLTHYWVIPSIAHSSKKALEEVNSRF